MERYVCIHGHFYQPPREHAWLEAVELQDSAYPYHDWNERITAECYAPNAVARILDGQGRIVRLVNNYARISFNFGPTLLAWLEGTSPDVYRALLEADRDSQQRFAGHGSALAQVYNHVILPLANRRDKRTQVLWGIRDFERRFGRKPEGLWLAETAVDLETLEVLAECGVRFTVLSPYQAGRVRKLGPKNGEPSGAPLGEPPATLEEWQPVAGGHIDPTRAYLQKLPSGRSIALFFYDGPIARAVAFERLLARGEDLAARLRSGFSDARDWPQLVHIATDGESYGHHHPHGDMALAYALQHLEAEGIRLTNYGEFLARHPPTHEVDILENTSWSCAHGVERWRSDCGCNTGRPGWNQTWRGPLRDALDWLRDALARCYEQRAGELLNDPWAARDDYLAVILDRSPDSVSGFLDRHAVRQLEPAERVAVLKLLELQRNAQLMYTSCGWFFDEISGLETVQVIQYAARALQLGGEMFGHDFEAPFLDRLAKAPSNLPEYGNGRLVYEKLVRPAMIGWEQIGGHYAVSSLFESYAEKARVYCYTAERQDHRLFEAGKAKLVVGRARVASEITGESAVVSFGVMHFGDHNVNGGIRAYQGEEAYQELMTKLAAAFTKADFAEIIRLMDRGFGASTYSLRSLFRDEQRRVIKRVLAPTLTEAETVYRRLHEAHLPTLRFLAGLNAPLPRAFQTTAEFLFNTDLRWAVADDEPNPEHISNLLKESAAWHVKLDTAGLAYKLKQTVRRMAERMREHPGDLAVLRTFDGIVGLAQAPPFEVDLWHAQNVYVELLRTACPGFLDRAGEGDDAARAWLSSFTALGERLGVQVAELKATVARVNETPTVEQMVREIFLRRHTPLATYRLQFNRDFPFAAARELVPYLHELGVTDVYASPILRARPGSTHGYDICDHSRINPELGGDVDFDALAAALREHRMGLILDIVPNHMGIGDANPWWVDVLENGPASPYAAHFDIDWHPANPDLENKVLLPVLGDQYGAVLEKGQLRLGYEDGAFFLSYYETKLPIAPETYRAILEYPVDELTKKLGAEEVSGGSPSGVPHGSPPFAKVSGGSPSGVPHGSPPSGHAQLQELRSILTALSYLPPRTQLPPEKREERHREKEIVKRRIAALTAASPEVKAAVAAAVAAFNGEAGSPPGFDLLDALVNAQSYRPAYWRVAAEEINYRRFFDVNELAAIRVERPEVFEPTHQVVFRLLAEGKAHGLRIDHPDGLWNPVRYFRQLQENYVLHRARAFLAESKPSEGLQKAVSAQLAAYLEKEPAQWPSWPLYVVAEKILGENEPLPRDWAVSGTTGYDFLNEAGGLFVDRDRRDRFDALYARFTGQAHDFGGLVRSCQRIIMQSAMASEVISLSHQLDRISERNRRYRDFTLNSLTAAIREIIAALGVYRTYITGAEAVSARDRTFVERAVAQAKSQNSRIAEAVFDFVRDTVLLRNVTDFREEDRPQLLDWVMKFQQLTGPVLAKGLEDTAFYVFNRLVALNEVGGAPERFGVTVDEFHRASAARREQWPHSMLATSSHDTKRGEDVRARIAVLSELPDEWEAALQRWGRLNAAKKTIVEGKAAPDANDEYLLYQTLLGVWPNEEGARGEGQGASEEEQASSLFPLPSPLAPSSFARFRERIATYMQKATKEAKVHTSWVNPNEEYDAAMRDFVARLLPDDPKDPFLTDLRPLQQRVAFFGAWGALAQLQLKLACPGVPDLYQGSELWSYTLVDPDNRGAVDYGLRRSLLAEVKGLGELAGVELTTAVRKLVERVEDGRIKLYVTSRGLSFRRAHGPLFLDGAYAPLGATGAKAAHVCAFARTLGDEAVLVAVPRLVVGLTGGEERPPLGEAVWQDTRLLLPPEEAGRHYRNLYTGEVLTVATHEGSAALSLSDVLGHFPVALLERLAAGQSAGRA